MRRAVANRPLRRFGMLPWQHLPPGSFFLDLRDPTMSTCLLRAVLIPCVVATLLASAAGPVCGWQTEGTGPAPAQAELLRRMDELRARQRELAERLEQARHSGGERTVAELEERRARLRAVMHQVEEALVAQRQRSGEPNRSAGDQPPDAGFAGGDAPRPRAVTPPARATPPAREPAQRLRQLTERLRNAELASENLRKAGLDDLVEPVERRVAAWRAEREALLQRLEAERREAAARTAAEKNEETAGGDGSGRADRARQWEALRQLTDEVKALRQEVEALRKRN